MAIEIGRTLRRRREWARLTQQELVDHTGLDRSLTVCPDLRSALAAERHEPANPSPQVLAGGMAARDQSWT